MDLRAVAAGEGGIVHRHGDGDGRRIDRLSRQGPLCGRIADGVGHGRLGEASQGDDVAGQGIIDRLTLQAAKGEDLADPATLHLGPVAGQGPDCHPRREAARLHPPGQQAPEERIGFDQHRQQLRRLVQPRHGRGSRRVLDDLVEQRREAFSLVGQVGDSPALLAAGVEMGKVELSLARAQGREEIEGFVEHPVGLRVRSVDLVEHDDRTQPQLQRLAEDELGLRHHPLFRVDQQQRAVDHAQDPLHLAAEIGVAGRVDDIDPRLASRAAPVHARDLGENGDPALALLVVGIHRPLEMAFVGPEDPGLRQHLVHQRRLAVVHMGDDGDVAERHAAAF